MDSSTTTSAFTNELFSKIEIQTKELNALLSQIPTGLNQEEQTRLQGLSQSIQLLNAQLQPKMESNNVRSLDSIALHDRDSD